MLVKTAGYNETMQYCVNERWACTHLVGERLSENSQNNMMTQTNAFFGHFLNQFSCPLLALRQEIALR